MRSLASFSIAVALASCSAAEPQAATLAGPLTPERLAQAARAAGFQVRELKADIPRAVRPRLPFDAPAFDDPRLAALREKYAIEKVVAGARDEWTAQLLLKEWVHKAIPGGNPRVRAASALEILDCAARGETFYCTHYAITYAECALALGWQARKIGVDRRHGPEGLGSTHHGVSEVWSNQFRKWAVIDPQSNLHFERKGVPLSAWEIRAEWLRDGGKEVDHVVGVPPRATRKNPAIVWWDRAGEDETSAYFWLYVEDHAVPPAKDGVTRFLLPQDEANEGLIWYQNDYDSKRSRLHTGYHRGLFVPTRRIEEVYWTVGIVEAEIAGVSPGAIRLRLDRHAPNGSGIEASSDEKTWERVLGEDALTWKLRPGLNSLRLHTVGRRGVTGPETVLLLVLD